MIYVELTNKELGYLELYKGKEEGIKYLYPNIKENMYWYYAIDYKYKNINSFINFVFTLNPKLLKDMIVWNMDGILDMIFTLSDVACRYALENPITFTNLYRMEHKDNLNSYDAGGMTMSFKSTSKSNSEVTVFEEKDSVGLKFETEGFIPYIDIDRIINGSIFSDEKEVVFPPCIQSYFTGEKENHHHIDFTCLKLQDDFKTDWNSFETDKTVFEQIKKDFVNEMNMAIKTGVVTEKLTEYCQLVSTYIYQTLRNTYQKYANYYQNNNHQGFSR